MFAKTSRAHREFHKGMDIKLSRATRSDSRVQFRKKQREAHLQKRRRQLKQNLPNKKGGKIFDAKLSDLSIYVSQVSNINPQIKYEGVCAIRHLLSVEGSPPIWQVLKTGIVPKIIACMCDPNTSNELQFEAAWVCTNIAASSEECLQLANMDIIPAFVYLFRNGTDRDVVEQAIWGLGNLAGENIVIRNALLQTGVFNDLVQKIIEYSNDRSLQKNAVWMLSNMCRHKPYPRWRELKCYIQPLAQLLEQTIQNNDRNDILVDILWTFTYLSDDPQPELNERVQTIVDCNVVQYLIQILSMEMNGNSKTDVKNEIYFRYCQPCMRAIGNIVTGTDGQTQSVLEGGFLNVIQPFLLHEKSAVRKEMLWTISNICAGNTQQIEYILVNEWLITAVINICKKDFSTVRREAGWVLCNAANGSIPIQKKRLVEAGAIQALTSLLEMINDEIVINMGMEGISALLEVYAGQRNSPWADIFEDCGGLDCLEAIQGNMNLSEDCYQNAVLMMEKYFIIDDGYVCNSNEDDDVCNDRKGDFLDSSDIQPNVNQDSNQFSFGFSRNSSTSVLSAVTVERSSGSNANKYEF